jgi:phytoene dehydrogenase-like protein
MNGFETVIYEKHAIAGGLCTSWERNGYRFESGLQWILGSMAGNPFYSLWSELIDMENIRFVNHETRMEIETRNHADIHGSKVFHLYNNLDRLESYLLEIAPEDKKVIGKLLKSIRKIQRFEIPPMIKTVPALLTLPQMMKFTTHLPLLIFLNRIRKITNFSFAEKLKNPFLKEVFGLLFDGEELPLMLLTLPLAFSDKRSTGYPVGGATLFVGNLAEKYLSLGGNIQYSSAVNKICTESGRATGIELMNGKRSQADIVLSTADWRFTLFGALEGRFVNNKINLLNEEKKLRVYYSVFMVSLGVKDSYADIPHFFRIPAPFDLESPDGTKYNRLEVHVFNYDPTVAPDGHTIISMSFYTTNGDHWINLRNADPEEYNRQKTGFSEQIINCLETRLKDIRRHIEVIDIATPATYFRYTGNWQGSVQGWLPGKNIIARSPVGYTLPGLKNFYYSSHWSIPGGGLPAALKSARDVAQIICRDNGVKFSIPG